MEIWQDLLNVAHKQHIENTYVQYPQYTWPPYAWACQAFHLYNFDVGVVEKVEHCEPECLAYDYSITPYCNRQSISPCKDNMNKVSLINIYLANLGEQNLEP